MCDMNGCNTNVFGDFLYRLRKERGMTQAELADRLGVTNKAVSKWETGEAMPETALLVPLAGIFGVTVDELLKGERNVDDTHTSDRADGNRADIFAGITEEIRGHISNEINGHLFTRGKDDGVDTFYDKLGGLICGIWVALCVAAYVVVGFATGMWHPFWTIAACGGVSCGIIAIVVGFFDREKNEAKFAKGENPYTGGACGIIMLSCVITYLFLGAFLELWHPLWIVFVCGGVACTIVGAAGDFYAKSNR